MKKDLADQDYADLLWGLGKGLCVLFLGPELDVTLADGSRGNLSRKLAQRLSEGLSDAVPRNATLSDVAERYEDNARSRLWRQVEEFYSAKPAADSDPVLTHLASLPFPLVITTRHDSGFTDHLRAAGKEPVVRAFDIEGDVDHGSFEGTAERPLVYHLFGNVADGGNLVLSEGDIHKMLTQVGNQASRLPKGLQVELQDRLLLLVGFDIRRWHTRLLLSDLGLKKGRQQSFAIDEFDSIPRPDKDELEFSRAADQEAAHFFRKGFDIETVFSGAEGIAAELARRFAELGAGAEDKQDRPVVRDRVVLREAPRVFLSYRREDGQAAQTVYDQMKRAGLKPFLDKEDLRAGENWDAVLRKKVKESNYFVLLYSAGLAAERRSYVFKEIRLALDVQLEYGDGERFIVPFLLEDDLTLPDSLGDIQGVPLAKMEVELEKMARDFQRANR